MRRLLQFLSIAVVLILTSCATTPKPVTAESIPGIYDMVAGGFNESMNVYLNNDSTYSMAHKLFGCTDLSVANSLEVGFWKWENGLVILEPKTRSPNFPTAQVYAPAAFHRLLPKRDGEILYLVNPDFPKHYVLQREPDIVMTKD